jgi:hypothetical protein
MSKENGAERTRTVIVFIDSEVHTPFCHSPGAILDLGMPIADFSIQNRKSQIQNRNGWIDQL